MISQKPITIDTQPRDGYWAAYVDPLGITIYGKTENDADARARRAVPAALNSLSGYAGPDAVKNYLDSRGVRQVAEGSHTSSFDHDERIKLSLQPVASA